jgi:hypothetical protein
MKKVNIFIFIFFIISVWFNYYFFIKNSNNFLNTNSNIEKNIWQINNNSNNEKKSYNLFKEKIVINFGEENILKNMCNKNIVTYNSLILFKKNNENLFKKFFLWFNWKKYLSDKWLKDGFYFYDKCDFIPKEKEIYWECIIRTNLNHIFMRDGLKIVDLDNFPFNMNELNNNVVSWNCNYLTSNKYFSDFYQSCKKKKYFLNYLDEITKKLTEKICQK